MKWEMGITKCIEMDFSYATENCELVLSIFVVVAAEMIIRNAACAAAAFIYSSSTSISSGKQNIRSVTSIISTVNHRTRDRD